MKVTKDIDNQLFTSNRTITKENNLLSETYKIIHNMFGKQKIVKSNSSTFKEIARSQSQTKEVDMRFIKNLIQSISVDNCKLLFHIKFRQRREIIAT